MRTAIQTEHLRRAVLAELAQSERTSLELARRVLLSGTQADAARAGFAAAQLAARGWVLRVTGGGWRITDTGAREARRMTGRAA